MTKEEILKALREIAEEKEGVMIPYNLILHAIEPIQRRGCVDAVIYLLENMASETEAEPEERPKSRITEAGYNAFAGVCGLKAEAMLIIYCPTCRKAIEVYQLPEVGAHYSVNCAHCGAPLGYKLELSEPWEV